MEWSFAAAGRLREEEVQIARANKLCQRRLRSSDTLRWEVLQLTEKYGGLYTAAKKKEELVLCPVMWLVAISCSPKGK